MMVARALQGTLSHDLYVSPEAEEVSRPSRDLLRIGLVMGLPTSMTETETAPSSNVLADRFHSLVKTWCEECAHLSSVREMVLHPAYQQIVGMGPNALPFIFARLEHEPEHLFWALRAITGEDPVPPEHRGNINRMTQEWLRWAEKSGVRW